MPGPDAYGNAFLDSYAYRQRLSDVDGLFGVRSNRDTRICRGRDDAAQNAAVFVLVHRNRIERNVQFYVFTLVGVDRQRSSLYQDFVLEGGVDVAAVSVRIDGDVGIDIVIDYRFTDNCISDGIGDIAVEDLSVTQPCLCGDIAARRAVIGDRSPFYSVNVVFVLVVALPQDPGEQRQLVRIESVRFERREEVGGILGRRPCLGFGLEIFNFGYGAARRSVDERQLYGLLVFCGAESYRAGGSFLRIEVVTRRDRERSSVQPFGFARSILYGERTGHSESVRIGYCKGCFAAVVHGDLVSVTRLFGQSLNDCGFEHILRNIQRYLLRPDAACRIAVRRRVTDSDDYLGHVVAAEAVGRFECRTR